MTVVASRYRMIERIGQGGMGVVWRAHDELLRRDVAVKELHVRVGVDDDFQTRQVLREARAAARLRHPGVVAIHDVIVDAGRPMIVMELVGGRSLAQVVRQDGPLPEKRVAEIGARVLAALSVAHAQGVVHRDVKPANILLDGDRVVLTDFGIAAMTSDTTVTNTAAGSPEYLAPERVNGEAATPATDLWSLGVALCAAVRGESPFQRSDTQATFAAVLTHDPAPIPQAPHLWPVLATLLRKDPRERPTAADAGTELAAIAGIPADQYEPVGPPRKYKRLVAVVTVFALVMAGGIWLLMRQTGNAAEKPATSTISAPAGFTGHRGQGYTLAVPSDWFKDSSDQEIYWVSDTRGDSNLTAHIEWWHDGHDGGARGLLSDFESGEFTMDFITDYKRIRLEETPAPRGMTCAELETTYLASVEEKLYSHEVIRAVVTATGWTYILTVAAESDAPEETERLWVEQHDVMREILDSFHVTL